MRKPLFTFLLLLCAACDGFSQTGRIYTEPDPGATGGISGSVERPLSHALAVERERVKVFRGDLGEGGRTFEFRNLPIGKYDLVLVTQDGLIVEGLSLGAPVEELPEMSRKHLETRLAVADSFFNRHIVHRAGTEETVALALVERIRDRMILKHSGERLDANLRRLEIVELQQAADDWQMTGTRHVYRESEPLRPAPAFFSHHHQPELGNIRVVDSLKDLGAVSLRIP